jgi:hypothetical protein
MTAATSQHLADVLKAAGFTALAKRAEADEFHDFFSDHALPGMELAHELAHIASDGKRPERERMAAHHIRLRLIDGEFDASLEESEEWAEGPEGQDAFRRLGESK